ncbi:kinase-like domain-containing protein [Flagelloscypha sp. PMI_526]|nr:kinase-like domain-containing protein [Flagelloscypha sp. PMI_526]
MRSVDEELQEVEVGISKTRQRSQYPLRRRLAISNRTSKKEKSPAQPHRPLSPPPPPRDPEPELLLAIEPIDDIEVDLAEHKHCRNEILAKNKPLVTKASTHVRDGDGDTVAAEDFELSKAKSQKLDADRFGAVDYCESADCREDAECALLPRPRDAMGVSQEGFEKVEDVLDDEDVDEKSKKVVKKVKKAKPVNIPPDGGMTQKATPLNSWRDSPSIENSTSSSSLSSKPVLLSQGDATLLHDATPKREVAIKTTGSQETTYKSGKREAALLAKLNAADPDDKRHVVRLERTFEWLGHFCIVMEGLGWNLRVILKRFGKDVGLSIAAVKAYAIQIFLALSLFKKESITHADIKPDNILISNNKTTLKVCDLGSAADASSAESTPTPYLVSRFYRAPEIILGLPHDSSLDTWSVGCTLFELYTGRILFPDQTNRHMLQLHMECKGRLNSKLIKKAKFGTEYFDDLGAFFVDSPNGGDGAKVFSSKAERDVKTRLLGGSGGETKEVRDLVDLIEKCLVLDSG